MKSIEKHPTLLSVHDFQSADAKDSIEKELSALERQIATAMTEIASEIDKKYVECIPDLVTSNKLLDTIRSACDAADSSVESIADSIQKMEKEVQLNENVLERLKSVKDWKSKMSSLEKTESLICQLWYSSSEENIHTNARLITELETELQNIAQGDESVDKAFLERIGPALKTELITIRHGLTHTLNTFWDQTFLLREFNDKVILQLPASSSDSLNEKLSAMDILNLIDGKVSKLSSALMCHFCQELITAKDPTSVISYRGVVAFLKREYVVRKEKQQGDARKKRPDPETVFQAMLELFKNLGKDFENITVNGKCFVQLIGDKISNYIVKTLVHECLAPAVPYESKDMPKFEALIASSNDFASEMKGPEREQASEIHVIHGGYLENDVEQMIWHMLQKLGFFTDSTESFQKFAENYENTFINRRCSKIIAEARSFIEAPLTEFIQVGTSSSTDVETVEDFYNFGLREIGGNDVEEENYPKLLQLPRCEVSKTAVSFANLIVRTLKDATEAQSASAMAKILQTARNIVELYVLTASRKHDSEISSVPLLAAIFYNNCYYICHRLMSVAVEVLPKMKSALQANNLCISFSDFIPSLRQLAAESMEKQLTQCRRQLATLLADEKIFVGLADVSQYEKCMKCLEGCKMQIEQISGIWKMVLTETVYANCLGNIVSFFFDTLMKMLLSVEDIHANDAELSAIALNKILMSLEKLFIIGDSKHSSIHKYAESPYFRLKELIFCLDSSLQNIYDRWCDGKGPLAQWLRASEVRHLVKALFQNTEKRAFVLSKIN